jgi:hypothetical protein
VEEEGEEGEGGRRERVLLRDEQKYGASSSLMTLIFDIKPFQ